MTSHSPIKHFISAEEYNSLPHIDIMRDAAEHNAPALNALLGLIREHGLHEKLSVHLLHKHFEAPDGTIMVYETKVAAQHPTFMIFGPRKIQSATAVRGLHYQARSGGKMRAYEYTADAGDDASVHQDFMTVFSNMCFKLGVQDVFALTVRRPLEIVFTEIEWPEFGATILFDESTWHPDEAVKPATITDWTPPADAGMAGTIELECLETRSKNHINVTCQTTSSGTHEAKKTSPNGALNETPYELDGKVLHPGTDMFNIFDTAYRTLAVY